MNVHRPSGALAWARRTTVACVVALAAGGALGQEAPEEPTPPAARTPSPSADAVSLTIATWNLALHAPGDRGSERGRAAYGRYGEYVAAVGADVIALQEVATMRAAYEVFDPDVYEVYLSFEGDSRRTGFAFKRDLHERGIVFSRNPDLAALDVGGLRRGTDITVAAGARTLRLLSVHLKSGCFELDLDSPTHACRKLRKQIPALERWIDDRVAEGTAFVVLGDFNRRFDAPGDEFWPEIDDGVPPGANLLRVTKGRTARCWGKRYPRYIDHIVLDRRSAAWLDAASFREHLYPRGKRVSDHCAISVRMELGRVPQSRTESGEVRAEDRREPRRRRPEGMPRTSGAASRWEDKQDHGSSRGHSGGAPSTASGPSGARVKGNVDGRGRRLYHLPDCPAYARTVIDESRGERWFRTEAEARAAGWTKAGNCP